MWSVLWRLPKLYTRDRNPCSGADINSKGVKDAKLSTYVVWTKE